MSQIDRKSTGSPAGRFLPFWNISRKLLIPSVIVMVTLALGLIIYTTIFTIQRNQSEATRDLTRTQSAIESSIGELQTLALGFATETANTPQIQAAFASHDRTIVTEITLPIFQTMQKDFAVKQFQFILPPATSFLRLHQLDQYGDDLSSFRFTVLQANATKSPISGIEIGRGGLGVRGEAPVFYQGNYIGIVDVGLDIGSAYLQNIKKQYGVDVQILLDKEAAQTATFAGTTSQTVGPTPNLLLQTSTFGEPLYADPTVYNRALQGETIVSQLTSKNKTYSLISSPLKDYSGKVIGVLEISLDRTDIIASQYQSLVIGILLSLMATILGGYVLVRLINYNLEPINALTDAATSLAAGNLDHQVVVRSNDELGILASAFNNTTSRLRDLIGTLEARVAERTQSLELAADVGRSVSQVRNLNVMLKDAAEIIRSRFDLYYVQVYLTNPGQTALVLQSGTGTVGAELVGRGHQLPLNTASINGRAASERHSIVVADTTASPTFKPNPLLPDTHSEMAVPLLVGEKVVGVLDLQSQKAGSLSQDILPAFEALAGQLAIAIQNASLLSDVEQARAEVEAQARRLVRTNWKEYLDAIHQPEQIGYVFAENRVAPVDDIKEDLPLVQENSLSAPITVIGEPLGNLVVELDAQNRNGNSAELITLVANQVARQIESLRLLESAERYRAEAEEASHRLTREGWQAYVDTKTGQTLGYKYDTNEVLPLDGDQPTNDAAATLPLKVRDEAIGRLSVLGLQPNDTESLELASAVAERLGAHIEGLRQYDQTQSALAQSEKLFEASRRLTQSIDLQGLVKSTVESLGVHDIDRVVLGAIDYGPGDEMEGMTIVANWSSSAELQATAIGTKYSKEMLTSFSLFTSSEPLFFNDMLQDKRVDQVTAGIAKRANYRTLAALPLFIGPRQDGVLLLEGEKTHNFTQDEIRLFSALAPQIATVLENRRQFERAQKQAERESMLNTISQKIQSATTVEAVLQIAARELGHALGAPLTIAQLGMKDHGN